MIRELLSDVLEDLTPNIFTAENGLAALEVIDKEDIDIVLTDISMPKMNGDDLFFELKKKKFTGEVIFLTAFADKSLVQVVMREGAFDVIDKPIKEEILLGRVNHAIDKVLSNRFERQFFESVSEYLGYQHTQNYGTLEYRKRQEYLEGLLAVLQLKNENRKSRV